MSNEAMPRPGTLSVAAISPIVLASPLLRIAVTGAILSCLLIWNPTREDALGAYGE